MATLVLTSLHDHVNQGALNGSRPLKMALVEGVRDTQNLIKTKKGEEQGVRKIEDV